MIYRAFIFRTTYRYNVSYVLSIIQSFKSNSNHFVILKGGTTAVTAIYCCINLFNVFQEQHLRWLLNKRWLVKIE